MTKILITGGSGFIGRHTIKLLQEKTDYEVFDYSLYTGYDICDYAQLKETIQPGDKILHLAAVARFASSQLNPARTFHINVGGTVNVIRAAIRKKAERIVHASTGSCYMPVLHNPITEGHRLYGNSIYGQSKRLGEEMYPIYYADDHGTIPYVILRYAHLFGTGKTIGGIYNFIDRMKRGLKPTLYGGKQSNDFCYVKDVARANLIALETKHTFEAFNIGTGTETVISEVYDIVKRVMGVDIEPEVQDARIVDQKRFVYNVSKAKQVLGFEAEWGLRAGIEDMVKHWED
ncbi:NAD-dependent epimerase/dehydratase family protein [Candidatus Pacearchaeota archaeon]|nr:NAD-dependent epimerase/dehydratase family protein [Candidatus Pacearchaeota archaeon]